MISMGTNEYRPDRVSPPGETLLEMLEERGLRQSDLAERTGRPRKTINEIIKGKAAITPETALQLELVLGAPAEFWNQREKAFRSSLARQDEAKRLAGWKDWLRRFPYADMVNKCWVASHSAAGEKVRELLSFFAVVSPEQWREVHEKPQAAFHKSNAHASDVYALSAWLRRGVLQATEIHARPFDRDKFEQALAEIRGLTELPIQDAVPQVKALCADAGVAVVFVPQVKKSRASGVTRWLSPSKALIQLSLRYKTDDHLWFTFFHEAGHILLHGKRQIFLEDGAGLDKQEQQANQFAADHLIPPSEAERLYSLTTYSQAALRDFASSIGVAPGIVVGRLQHDKRLSCQICNGLKRKLQWKSES